MSRIEPLSTNKLLFKKDHLNKATHSLYLDGIDLPEDIMADLLLVDEDKMTLDELFQKTLERAKKIDAEKRKLNIHT